MKSPRLAPALAVVVPALAALVMTACGDDSKKIPAPGRNGFGGAGSGYDASAAGASGASGAAGATSHQDASACPSMAFNLAPVPCSYDFAHAKLAYTLPCTDPAAKGYLAGCAPYDAVIAHEGDVTDYCFYSKQTGNLIGAVTTKNGVRASCLTFHLDFQAPDVSACAPVVPGTCPP